MSQKYALIPVLPQTKNRIDNLGKKGQTYDELVNYIIDKITKTTSTEVSKIDQDHESIQAQKSIQTEVLST